MKQTHLKIKFLIILEKNEKKTKKAITSSLKQMGYVVYEKKKVSRNS